MSLDPRQREAAEAPASVVVTAGAGTGKTHMLARRYLHHLRAGMRPLEVVAVTFTRRAAEELRARVREVVRAALAAEAAASVPAGEGAATRSRLDPDALAEVEAAPIGTIHALAQLVCRRYPEAAGVPPDFGVVDELDGALWTAEALDEALARLDDEHVVGLPYDLLRAAIAAALDDPTRARAALAIGPEEVRAAVDDARRAAFDATVGDAAWREAVGFLGGFAGPDGHEAETARRQAVAAANRLDELGPDGDPDAAAGAWSALAGLAAHRGAKKDWRGPDLGAVKAALRHLRDAARAAWDDGDGPAGLAWSALDERAAAIVARLRDALDGALAIVDERKRRAKALSFADLETHALRALENPDVRAQVHLRWRALLVDEVQDVNPTQARLLAALRAEDAPLTAVGDAKQSIYGFRGAEPAVLADLRARVALEDGGRTVALGTNYRSHGELVEVVNRVFERALGADAGPLAAARARPAGLPPTVRYQRVARPSGARASELAAAEVDAIAAAILGWVRADPPVTIADGAGGPRPLGFGDVAVLARGHAALALLEARLPALGVPVLNAGGGDVLATRVASDVRALLRAVIDPTDGVAVAALLRSPYVAAHDADILRFATAAAGGPPDAVADGAASRRPWWRRLPTAAADPRTGALAPAAASAPAAALAHAGALLADLRRARAAGACASELVELADDRCGIRATLGHLPEGPRRVADHDGFVDLLERLEQGSADALGVVRRLERLVAAGVRVPRPPLRASGAVALLTIHAAKGLEWPAVVVADLAGGGGRDRDDVLLDPRVGFALRWPDGRGGLAEPAGYRLAAAAAARRELEERRRLAYVAFTRARELLLVSDRGGANGGLRAALDDALAVDGVQHEEAPYDASAAAGAPPMPPPPPAPDPHDPGVRRMPWPREPRTRG
jgi:ATP-dependent helicase/nuclease subunit A